MVPFILFATLVVAGLLQASFAVPMKYFRGWRWEQVWVGQALASNVVLPGIVLLAALMKRPAQFPGFTPEQWLVLGTLGAVWGAGGIGYGLSLVLLGISFTYSVVFSATTLAGVILPLALGWNAPPAHAMWFICGLALCLAGTFTLARAGARRENEQGPEADGRNQLPVPVHRLPYAAALLMALVAGVFSSGLGLALAWGEGLVREMTRGGASPVIAPLVVWIPAFLGSALVTMAYGLWCSLRSDSLPAFWRATPGWNWMLVSAMGILGFGGIALYGIGATAHRHLPENVAWGIYMSSFILSGNLLGVLAKEWRGCSRRTYLMFGGGVTFLLGAILTLARA
jgi:L-rhamnose-H+ transport protein